MTKPAPPCGVDPDREALIAAYDTSALLRAVDDLDAMRQYLDGDGYRPPEMRDDLLRLHQLAMHVVNEGSTDPGTVEKMFDLAIDIEASIDVLSDALERLRETIGGLAALAPED